MKRSPLLLRMALALCFVVPTSCATSRAVAPDGERARAEPKLVRVDELSGDRLRLSFEPVAPDPALEVLRLEESKEVLVLLHESLPQMQKPRPRLRLVLASTGQAEGTPAQWELHLREEYLFRFGDAVHQGLRGGTHGATVIVGGRTGTHPTGPRHPR